MPKLLLPEAAREWLIRRYNNQHRAWLVGEGEWPMRVSLGSPTEREVVDDMHGVQAWVDAWASWTGPGQLQWEERKWPRLGTQRLPVGLQLSGPRDVACAVKHEGRWLRAASRYAFLTGKWPQLANRRGLERHFDVLAEYSETDLNRLTAALDWLLLNPDSGLYLRQLPIAGLDTKWLEKRTSLIVDLLNLARGTQERDFHEVCGLKKPPVRLRMRILCPKLRKQVNGLCDIDSPLEDIAQLSLAPKAVIIVENLETGIALPDLEGVVVFMKLGHAVGLLDAVPWLKKSSILYWGDIDTHGFVILSKVRCLFPEVHSILMDRDTLLAHRELWTQETSQHTDADPPFLTKEERDVFDKLKSNEWSLGVRLEQERLSWKDALAALEIALHGVRSGCSNNWPVS